MKAECCVCGEEQPIIAAIEAEQERKELEDDLGVPVPTIGIVCEDCQYKHLV